MATPTAFAPQEKVHRFAKGERISNPTPGDFLLTHGNAWTSWLIRVGQQLRYFGARRKYTYWSHAALFVGADGALIEAVGSGVRKGNVSEYDDTDYHVVHITASADDRDHEVAFATHCLNDQYGILTIVSVAFSLLTGTKFSFGVDGQLICSSLVARALERTGEIFKEDPWHITPADLAMQYQVEPPGK